MTNLNLAIRGTILAVLFSLVFAGSTRAQSVANLFQKPAITSVFHPVVGDGSLYETSTHGQDAVGVTEMTVVGRDSVDGRDAYWLEFGRWDKNVVAHSYAKLLLTKEDFQMRRMIVQQSGQPPMEIVMNPGMLQTQKRDEAIAKWHVVGTDSITVPAGTFSCQHWQGADASKGDVWTSDKVTPFGMVKQVMNGDTMVLVKVITGAQDHITGPVQKFDPAAMQRQMMERMQQRKQKQQ